MTETNLTQEQALSVLISAARVAQSKGAFTLEDASLIQKAIMTFIPNKEAENKLNAANGDVVTSPLTPDTSTSTAEKV